jgi:hypothetical protein
MIRTFAPTILDLIIIGNRKRFLENEDKSKTMKQKAVKGLRDMLKNDLVFPSPYKMHLKNAEKRLKNHEQESAELTRNWFSTMAYIKRHGHDLNIDGPICHCDVEGKEVDSDLDESDHEGQEEWENIYQEYDQKVGDRKFHFYETYGGGPSGGYATLVDSDDKVWSWSQRWGTEKDMRLLTSKIEIKEDPVNNCYLHIRVV